MRRKDLDRLRRLATEIPSDEFDWIGEARDGLLTLIREVEALADALHSAYWGDS